MSSSKSSASLNSLLGNTVDTFASRIQRKLRDQEINNDENQKASEIRQELILQAMSTIRRALQETAKINLGTRFKFRLDVNDWEGWPRVELNLIDNQDPETVNFGLVVTAHDRNEQGMINLVLKSGDVLARLSLADTSELQRLPLILKKAVRAFLDSTAEYVLNPEEVTNTTPLEYHEEEQENPAPELTGDVFSDDEVAQGDHNRVSEEDVEDLAVFAKVTV